MALRQGQKQRLYISYDYDNDRHFKNLLLAWSANERLKEFEFLDHSTDVGVRSTDDAVIKRVISRRIGESSHFLCIIGERTHTCDWVLWEIAKAVELGKPLIAVKTKRANLSPLPILSSGAAWAMGFSYASVVRAIQSCGAGESAEGASV